jgi:hypothetical protein
MTTRSVVCSRLVATEGELVQQVSLDEREPLQHAARERRAAQSQQGDAE